MDAPARDEPRHFIINVGLARCGTTATHAYFHQDDRVATPSEQKEIKYFFTEDPSRDGYLDQFSGASRHLFESSPPYCHLGTERFTEFVQRMERTAAGHDQVTVLFNIRNLLQRAFSHYWHDIGSQYARFGGLWAVRRGDDPKRFQSIYSRSFTHAVKKDRQKFLPDVASLMQIAVDTLGVEHVRIAFIRQLDDCIADLLSLTGVGEMPTPTPRLAGAGAPMYVYAGPDGGPAEVETTEGTLSVELPPHTCLLFSQHHSEALSDRDYDIERIVNASETWSYDVVTSHLPDWVFDDLREQQLRLRRLPEELFLNGARDAVLEDLEIMPDTLSIQRIRPEPSAVATVIERAAQ